MGQCDDAQMLVVFPKVTDECLGVPGGVACGILDGLWSSRLLWL